MLFRSLAPAGHQLHETDRDGRSRSEPAWPESSPHATGRVERRQQGRRARWMRRLRVTHKPPRAPGAQTGPTRPRPRPRSGRRHPPMVTAAAGLVGHSRTPPPSCHLHRWPGAVPPRRPRTHKGAPPPEGTAPRGPSTRRVENDPPPPAPRGGFAPMAPGGGGGGGRRSGGRGRGAMGAVSVARGERRETGTKRFSQGEELKGLLKSSYVLD